MQVSSNVLSHDHQRLISGRHHDPFTVLGPHRQPDGSLRITVFAPFAETLALAHSGAPFERVEGTDLFVWQGPGDAVPAHYLLRAELKAGGVAEYYDPYSFGPQIPEFDLYLFSQGNHWHIYRYLGAHPRSVDGIDGVLFATWAPNAERVSVVGDFNGWDGRSHPMRNRGSSGVWEIFIPGLPAGMPYKFELINRDSGALLTKTDPYGQWFERRPATAARIPAPPAHVWQDDEWLRRRRDWDWQHSPIAIYEAHLGSWQRDEQGNFLNYRELAHRLAEHVTALGYTHVELLPVAEHPLDASWGYQVTGYYAPTARFGTPDDFRYFVDYLHQQGIGVILDWVPAHFPRDDWALSHFDGTALYEHEDPRRGEHRDWGTRIFNYGRNEVRNFLISNAVYWLEEFHIDGLRVDAVASMLYLDYSREPGDWLPNQYGGNENLEAIDFLRQLNSVVGSNFPGAIMVAEESTAWPAVSRPTWVGGLGFSMKWNMGWMHDTLDYFAQDPIFRRYHHERLTFGMLYQYSENFVLPFSHDEVVHGKRSLLSKMPGDFWQQFANLRLLYTYHYTYPGKKLLFMGGELAQREEWNHATALPWHYLDYPEHRGVRDLLADLNRLYRSEPALHGREFESEGFAWIDCHDSEQSVISFLRRAGDAWLVVVLNFTPVPRHDYRIGVPAAAAYEEVFNSDSAYYGGSNLGNAGRLAVEDQPWMGQPVSLSLTLPPLAGIILRPAEG